MAKKKEPPNYPGDEAIKQKFGEVMRELRLEKGLATNLSKANLAIDSVGPSIDDRALFDTLTSAHEFNAA